MRALIPYVFHLAVLWITASSAFAADPIRIKTLSNDPQRVSGGDVLIRIDVPPGVPLESVAVTRNGQSVRDAFHPIEGNALLGVVDGLRIGSNVISAAARNAQAVELAVVNHPRYGPVFSGPHERPFICGTAEFKLPDGRTLGEPLDEHCSAETVVTYLYRSKEDRKIKPLTDPAGRFPTSSVSRPAPSIGPSISSRYCTIPPRNRNPHRGRRPHPGTSGSSIALAEVAPADGFDRATPWDFPFTTTS
jgi:hypothetical protein